MQKEFLTIDEVLQILNIHSKEYLSRYLKKKGVKVFRGRVKPYPKDAILKLAKKRQDENHHNSKQNEIALYIDENSIKDKPKIKTKQDSRAEVTELSLNDVEQELTQKIIKNLENLGIYDPLENDIIKAYARNLILLECSSKQVEKTGFTTFTDKGTPIITPELVAFNSLTKNVAQLAKILGIGAPSRVRISPKEQKEASHFDLLLKDNDE